MTKKEVLKNAIKNIVLAVYHLGVDHDIEYISAGDEFWNRKANEIIKEVEIRFKLGDDQKSK